MSVRPILAIAVITLALAGCGTSARDAVKAKVEQYGRATHDHDYKTLCTQVLDPALVRRLNVFGPGCERAMAEAYGSVSGAALALGKITVHGHSASMVVIAMAANQPSALRTIGLTKTSGGWRVSSEQFVATR